MTLPVFQVLTNALTRGSLSQRVIVTMDGDPYDVRCVYVRRQIPMQTDEGQVYISAVPSIELALADLPRRPEQGDRVLLDTQRYKLTSNCIELGNGMIECGIQLVA